MRSELHERFDAVGGVVEVLEDELAVLVAVLEGALAVEAEAGEDLVGDTQVGRRVGPDEGDAQRIGRTDDAGLTSRGSSTCGTTRYTGTE